MANGVIKKQGLVAVVTNFPVGSFSGAINAHKGLSLGQLSVDVPTGYHLVCNISCATAGVAGLIGSIDGALSVTSATPSIYVYNATTNSYNVSSIEVWILSLCERG